MTAEIINEVYSNQIDLQDHPLEEADWTQHADRSSYMENETERLGVQS